MGAMFPEATKLTSPHLKSVDNKAVSVFLMWVRGQRIMHIIIEEENKIYEQENKQGILM